MRVYSKEGLIKEVFKDKNRNRDCPQRGLSLFLSSVFIVGLSGAIAQIIILRELLVCFLGNELTIGIILANWVILEALGVFVIGKVIDNLKNKVNLFIVLEIIFCLSLISSLYLSRVLKFALNVLPGEGLGLALVFLSSLIIMFPLSFTHGALFSVVCSLSSIGKAYAWEIAGSILGGLALAYIFIPRLNSFQIAGIIISINLIIALVLKNRDSPLSPLMRRRAGWGQSLFFISAVLLFIIFFQPALDYLKLDSLKKAWQGLNVLESKDSLYGNITVTRKLEQFTFFYNGIPVITTPYPDRQFSEDFANLPLLFHPAPRAILIAGAGAGGLIDQALKHSLNNLDYVEIDPLIITLLKKYPTDLTQRELNDPRVKVINTDPRLFLNKSRNFYDLILIGLSNQSNLSTNRLFTEEFFILSKKRMGEKGIIALWLPGSLTYLSRELKDLNKSVFNALKSTYKFVRIIPGDYNIYLASDSGGIIGVTPEVITQRIRERRMPEGILIPSYLKYRLAQTRQDWFTKELVTAGNEVNRDLRPIAVFDSLLLWNKKFSPKVYKALGIFKAFNLRIIFGALILIAVLFFVTCRSQNPALGYSIFTTGFFGMLANLLLIFSYQIFYGYLYQKISILIALFMAGIVLGSGLIVSYLGKIKEGKDLFIKLEAALTLFTLAFGLIITRFNHSLWVIYALLFISGLFVGSEFPLANKIYSGRKEGQGSSVGTLYAADLMGGWLAGLFAGIIFLPLLGFLNSCLVIFILKLSSLCCLLKLSRSDFLI